MNSQNLFLALVNSTVYVVFFYGSEKHSADYYSKMQNNKPKKSINKVTDAFLSLKRCLQTFLNFFSSYLSTRCFNEF